MSSMRQDPSHRAVPSGRARGSVSGFGKSSGGGGGLSVVVPSKNEAASLPQLIGEIAGALRPLTAERASGMGPTLSWFEVVLVDDGSTDPTQDVVRSLSVDFPELRAVILAENVGQSAATAAGVRASRGEWVATLDADLQNDPADLARLWDALPGHDVALGWRRRRRDVWSKRVISRWANRARNRVLGQAIRDTGCSVRIFPREMALRLPMFKGCHRFFGPLLLREGCAVVQLPVNHRERPHGTSHYNIWSRSIRVIFDLFGVAWLMRRSVRYQVVAGAFDGSSTFTPHLARRGAGQGQEAG